MCFEIRQPQKPWRNRVAWKVVQICGDGYVSSSMRVFFWAPGEVVCKGGVYWSPGRSVREARAGIYVYRHEPDPLRLVSNFVVLKVHVNPADFLYHGVDYNLKQVATYKKVFVPENQPYIEWEGA